MTIPTRLMTGTERTKAREGMAKGRATNVSREVLDSGVTIEWSDNDEPEGGELSPSMRRRGLMACADQALEAAADAGHNLDWLIENAPDKIDMKAVNAALAAQVAWLELSERLCEACAESDASGSSVAAEDEVVDTIPPPDDIEIPPFLKRGRGRPPGSKNKPKPESKGVAE